MDIGQLLTLLLGGGATATIVALFNGVKSLREGARTREKDTVEQLVAQRKEAWDDRDKAFDARDEAFNQRDYWRNWAGQLEYLCQKGGIPVPPRSAYPAPPPPIQPPQVIAEDLT